MSVLSCGEGEEGERVKKVVSKKGKGERGENMAHASFRCIGFGQETSMPTV